MYDPEVEREKIDREEGERGGETERERVNV